MRRGNHGYLIAALVLFGIALLLIFFWTDAAHAQASDLRYEAPAARTVTVAVPRGATVAAYPVAGHSISEIRWRCTNARIWRTAVDWGWRPPCTMIVLTSRYWFTYEVRAPGRDL